MPYSLISWPMLHFESERLQTGWTLAATIDPTDRECEAILRLCTEILRRLPRVVGAEVDDEPLPEEVFATVRQQVFSPEVAGTKVPATWRLTPTETRIVVALAEGMGVHDIARTLGVTRETARTHLKRAMAKAGAHRQAELVKTILVPKA